MHRDKLKIYLASLLNGVIRRSQQPFMFSMSSPPVSSFFANSTCSFLDVR
jgi:hypothetical protein